MDPFIGLEDLSALLKRDLTDDPLAVIAIDAACQSLRTYLEQDINLKAGDEVRLRGDGTDALILPQVPVIAVSDVLEDPDGDELIEDVDWYLDRRHGILYRMDDSTCWPWVVWPVGQGRISITYTHGWAVDETDVDPLTGVERVPSDLRRVALSLAQRIYAGSGVTGPIRQETMGSYSYTLAGDPASDLSDGERRALSRYQRRYF